MNIGILGAGTIGGGVLDIIDNKLNDKDIKVVKVFDMPSKKELLGERYAENVDEVCLSGDVDVVVTDGFTGNVLLKGIEGSIKYMTRQRSAAINSPTTA